MTQAHVRDVTEETFAQDVLERSRTVPVLVDLWAAWCEPCKILTPTLEKLAAEYEGRFELAKVDVDANPGLAQAFGVQGIPALKMVVDGQLVDQVEGALPEQALRQFLDTYCGGAIPAPGLEASEEDPEEADPIIGLERIAAAGEPDAALAGLGELIAALEADGEGPEKDEQLDRARLLAARIAMSTSDAAGAQGWLDQLSDKGSKGADARELAARLTLGLPELGELERTEAELAGKPKDPGALTARGIALARAGQFDEALATLMASVRLDRAHGEEAARRGMVSVFDVLGPEDERTSEYRRKLQMALFV